MDVVWKFLYFLIFVYTVKADSRKLKTLRNLALHKPANQSSTSTAGDISAGANRAVDGIRQASWVPPYCTHTNDEYNPYWYVDLGGQHDILRVEILNRKGLGNRLRDISVVVADKYGEYDQTCGHFLGPGTHVPVVYIRCPNGTRGRFVKIQMATNPKLPLTLCEVEVYGY